VRTRTLRDIEVDIIYGRLTTKKPERTETASFPLAPMSRPIRALTFGLLALPLLLVLLGAWGIQKLMGPGLLVGAIYAWVWLRFRPTRFAVRPDMLEIVWPLKCRRLSRRDIVSVRLLDRTRLRDEIGWGVRVGAGGFGGGFGWFWTRRRGVVQMYVSCTDRFVWIERLHGRPWLITPERPEEFVAALAAPA
jgi:PH (Pleckstrin Homology) domain-containing protein